MARNKELNDKMKDERLEVIRSVAVNLFAHKGIAATKISDIARDAGMSQGLLYHYYKSKNEIFIEIIDTAFKRLITASENLCKMDMEPEKKLKFALEKILEGMEVDGNHSKYHFLVAQASVSEASPPEIKTIVNQNFETPYKIVAQIIEDGQNKNQLRDGNPMELALLFWSTVNGLAIYKTAHPDVFKAPDVEIIMRMFVKD